VGACPCHAETVLHRLTSLVAWSKRKPLRLGVISEKKHAAEWVKRLRVSNQPYSKGGLKLTNRSNTCREQEAALASCQPDSSDVESSEAMTCLSEYSSEAYMWEETLPTAYDSDSSDTSHVPQYVCANYFHAAKKLLVRSLQLTLCLRNFIDELCELCRKDTFQHSCKIRCRVTPT